VRNWFEYMLNNSRRQYLMAGASWSETNQHCAQLTRLLAALHVDHQPLPRILEEQPELAPLVQDETHFTAGRHWRFFQQLGEQDAPASWVESGAHALAIYGGSDFVSNRADHEAIADIVNRARPGEGRFVLLEGMDHGFREAADCEDSLRRMSTGQLGAFDPRIIDTLAGWMTEVGPAEG
jgi:hypothetical protein